MLMPDNTVFTPVQSPNMAANRTANTRLSMEARLSTFHEIEQTYTEEEALLEASRCLKCPTHWCQNACPAGVPVTDFIAQVRAGNYEEAYRLIASASTLPEICSRVCPQEKQCQSECTRGIRSQAVGIGRLERFVTERHYQSGQSWSGAASTGKRVAVVGSGPSGLSAAQRLADLGHEVTVFEKQDRIGGLLRYGIPNMKLDQSVLERKLDAMERQGVIFRTGVDVGTEAAARLMHEFDAVVLCVGAEQARQVAIEGAEGVREICPAVDYLSASTEALLNGGMTPVSAKDRDVVIIGGGDTGNDCVGTALRQGCKSVLQVELLPKTAKRPIIRSPYVERPREEKFDSSQEECLRAFCQDPRRYQTSVKAVRKDETGRLCSVVLVHWKAEFQGARLMMQEIPGSEEEIPCGLLIVAAGFTGPRKENAEAFGVKTTSCTTLDTKAYRTNVEHVFACGDCRTGQTLAVKAMTDGRNCAEQVDRYLKTK